MELFTIGHSTAPLEEFIDQLARAKIELLADVRRFPHSRRHPHFNRDMLSQSLSEVGMAYEWLESLGGRRSPRPDSANTGWENKSFQGYADYMETEEFRDAFMRLINHANERKTAIMCAEAQWWRCHRRLISDLVVAGGGTVWHLMGKSAKEHKLLPPAWVDHGRLMYPAAPGA